MDFVENPTLENISREVDALWSARCEQIKKNNKELQPLVYAAWKLVFAGHRGRPKAGEDSFSGWLAERKIPRQTGYDLLQRERDARGEINVRAVHLSESTDNGELDINDAGEGIVDAQNGTVAASVGEGKALASTYVKASDAPIHKPAPVNLKPTKTPEWFKTRRGELEKELRTQVGEKEASKIIDKCIVDFLEVQLRTVQKKTVKRADYARLKAA